MIIDSNPNVSESPIIQPGMPYPQGLSNALGVVETSINISEAGNTIVSILRFHLLRPRGLKNKNICENRT